MIYDLHCHSNCSDGELSVDALIDLAVEKKVTRLSITDHDTVQAYQQPSYQQAVEKHKDTLQIIPGIEFSTYWNKTSLQSAHNKTDGYKIGVHVVGLNIDPNSDAIAEGEKQQQQARRERAEIIAEKLEKLGLENALQGAQKHAGIAEVARPHFAQYMIEVGFSKSFDQAFKKYLGTGKAGDIKQGWASLTQVIEWIKDSGGVAVLAHPQKYKLTRTKLIALIETFKEAGGEAMEVLSGAEDKNVTAMLSQLCEQKKLLASLGSDFHYTKNTWCRLGMHASLPLSCQPVWNAFKPDRF